MAGNAKMAIVGRTWGSPAHGTADVLAGDVPLQAADDLLRQALLGAPLDVGAGGRVSAHPSDHDAPQCVVDLTVPAAAVPVPAGLPRGGGDRGDRAHVRPGGLAPQPLRAVTRG